MDEGRRGKAVARFEAATLAGLLAGFAVAGPLFAVLGSVGFLVNGVLYLVSMSIYRWGVDRNPAGLAGGAARDRWRPDRLLALPPDSRPEPRLAPRTHVDRGQCRARPLRPQTIFQLVKTADPQFTDQLLMGGFRGQISIGLAGGGLLFFAGLIYWGNRFKNLRRTTIILYGLAGGAALVVAAVAINHSATLPLAFLVGLMVAAFGLFVLAGATPAAIGLLADVTEAYPDDRGAIMGLYSVFLGLGQIGGSLIAGVAATAMGLDGIFVASLVLLLLAVVPLVFLRRRALPRRSGDARVDRLTRGTGSIDPGGTPTKVRYRMAGRGRAMCDTAGHR